MRILQLSMLILCLFTASCIFPRQGVDHEPDQNPTPGATLEPGQIPTPDQVNNTFAIDQIMYIENDTYAADPSLLIGRIFAIGKVRGTCVEEGSIGQPRWIDHISGYSITAPVGPVLRGSHVVNKSVAASIKFLNYLSASLNDSSIYSVIVTDQAVRRVNDVDEAFNSALAAWKQAHQNFMNDSSICWLAVVDGVVHKTIVRRHFARLHGNGTAGAFAVNVGGAYYVSDEDYQLDNRFGLSIRYLKWPSTETYKMLALPNDERGDNVISDYEREVFGSIKSISEKP